MVRDKPGQNISTAPLKDDPSAEKEPQSRMRRTATSNLKSAAMKLDSLMPKDAAERKIPGGIESRSFDVGIKNIDTLAQGIGIAVGNYMDQRSDLKASRGPVKVFVEKWFDASYPIVSKGLDIAAVPTSSRAPG